MAVANEELGESYLESLESALADELSFTFDFEQGPTESRVVRRRKPKRFRIVPDDRTTFQERRHAVNWRLGR